MKIIMFYAPSFWFKTYKKVLEGIAEKNIENKTENAVVIFYHSEAEDIERKSSVITKLIKNIKWLSGKFSTKNLVLHSFNHLSVSKAPPEFTNKFILDVRERLEKAGFSVIETPFGYLNEWKIHVAGDSLAKVFKDL